jgi:hypothetical protein
MNIFGQDLENNSYNNKYYYNNHKLYGSDSSLYSGEFKEYFPGEVKESGNYLNGLKDGTFYKYKNNLYDLLSVEHYSKGLKNGEFRKYYPYNECVMNLLSLENYKNDTLIDSYYWDKSGQLIKTIIDNQTKNYSIDSSIWTILFYIKGEKLFKPPYYYYRTAPSKGINRKYLCKKDPIKIQVAKITCTDCLSPGNDIVDTIVLNNFKVLSFSLSYSQAGDSGTGEDIIGDVIPEKYKAVFKSLPVFYLENVVILDNNNVQYYLTDAKYIIID